MGIRKQYMEISPITRVNDINVLFNKGLFIIDIINKDSLHTIIVPENKLNTVGSTHLLPYMSLFNTNDIIEYFVDNNNVINITDYLQKDSKEPYIIRYQNIINKFRNIDKYIKPVDVIHTYEKIDISNYGCPVAILGSGIYKFGIAKENKFYLRYK